MWQQILDWITRNPEWLAVFLVTVLETWLGRTDKVKSGSIGELIFRVLFKNKFLRVIATGIFNFIRRKLWKPKN